MLPIYNISEAIKKANTNFESTLATGDAEAMANLYTSEGMLLPYGSEILQGRQAIERFWKGAMDGGIKEAQLKTLEVEEQGDTAIEVGNYMLKGEGGHPIDQGKYLVVWKNESGEWKLHKDIFNSSINPL